MKGTVLLLYFVAFLCQSFCRASDMTQKMEALDNLVKDEEQRDLEQLQEKVEHDSSLHPMGEHNNEDEEEKLMNHEKAEGATENGQEAFPNKDFFDEDEANDGDVDGERTADDADAGFDKRLENARPESNYKNWEASDESEDVMLGTAKDNLDQNGDEIDILDDGTLTRERRWLFGSRRRSKSRRRTSFSRRRVTPVVCRGCKGVCNLRTFRGSALRGNTARIHSGFWSAMTRINTHAANCGVQIYITSSFRKVNRPIVGGIVPQATRSNHYIGHAIDMNVRYSRGRLCTSGCLMGASRPTEVSCFINKIRGDSGLRWGGDFSRRDPVHIDDGYNIRQPSSYAKLYQQLQKNCR